MIEVFGEHTPQIAATAWVHDDATVIGDVRIGPGVSVWPRAVLRGDMGMISVGEDSNVQDGVICHDTAGISRTAIGPRVTVGHGAILHGCVIEGDSIVGMGSILLDNCKIEPNCIIGAGALVPMGKVIPAGSLVLGSPGRVVRAVTEKDLEWIRYSWEIYKNTSVQYGRQQA